MPVDDLAAFLEVVFDDVQEAVVVDEFSVGVGRVVGGLADVVFRDYIVD